MNLKAKVIDIELALGIMAILDIVWLLVINVLAVYCLSAKLPDNQMIIITFRCIVFWIGYHFGIVLTEKKLLGLVLALSEIVKFLLICFLLLFIEIVAINIFTQQYPIDYGDSMRMQLIYTSVLIGILLYSALTINSVIKFIQNRGR